MVMTDHPVIRIEGLSVRYGSLEALTDVSLSVESASVYVLLGRNGAGKTSLIRCLLGLQRPTRGEARIFGLSTWSKRQEVMGRVGVVPEEPDAPPEMKVAQLVDFCRRVYRQWNDRLVQERLERFAVPSEATFGRLSKGQKAQVSLALALGHEPPLLVLDDPTLGLDVVARQTFFEEVITELADRGTTVFLTTHDLAAAEGLASRVGILSDSRLVLDEDLEIVKNRFRKIRLPAARAAEIESLGPTRVRQLGTAVEVEVTDFRDDLLSGFGTPAEVGSMSLEEIFVAVAGEEEPR
jgi:ABC-2 type transport system ATP-binding protein